MSNSANLECAINAIDQANQQDPNREEIDGESLPREYAYSLHMTRWLFELEPEPSERMQIACRAQHIERWTMPRSDYGEGRKNYYQWRQACGRMHGRRAAEIMAACDYPKAECERVETILTKRKLREDEDTQLLEDVACMVFLERYFAQFFEDNPDYDKEKWLRIVRRTWGKMTPRGHSAALKLAEGMPAHLLALLQEALAAPAE
ncbi:glutamyl-tRNA synthetase [Marinobacter sp. C1S70]|nr:glutamyl-tRNA synthetase [Marinobacter sp. C1S70]